MFRLTGIGDVVPDPGSESMSIKKKKKSKENLTFYKVNLLCFFKTKLGTGTRVLVPPDI